MAEVGSKARRHSLFISDLHLWPTRQRTTDDFVRFADGITGDTDALYILGDLFEYWAGDDDLADPHHRSVVQALERLHTRGVRCYLMHGNRDFLIGDDFADAAKLEILPDPCLRELYGHRVLLSHGDALCTEDIAYQQFRMQVRQPEWLSGFLGQPLAVRKAQIEALRMRSEQEKSGKSEYIMDVSAEAVAQLLRQHGLPELFIHGHTHRPARHDLEIDGHLIQRHVLGDWYDQGSCLRLDDQGCRALTLAEATLSEA
ncbi:MAG TPA: UDP-2,3-diacylglucosamine diphosphatase [Methylophilaceae bacterium]|jgi:UDP-2,3-diacylglucosamine hydrolase